MAFSVNDIRSALRFGGARPNQFEVNITFPGAVGGSYTPQNLKFFAEAASLPGTDIGNINVGYFGRFYKVAGDRIYPPWEIRILQDEDFNIRHTFETWINEINKTRGNTAGAVPYPVNYKATAIATQYGKTGNVIREYRFDGLFPTQISPIQLDWATQNQIERFSVRLEYDYHTPSRGPGAITG